MGVNFPREAREKFSELAEGLIDDKINTPEKLTAYLRDIGGDKLKKYAQAFWNTLSSVDPTLTGVQDWEKHFAPAEAEAEAAKVKVSPGKGWTLIGKNKDGQEVYENSQGVRRHEDHDMWITEFNVGSRRSHTGGFAIVHAPQPAIDKPAEIADTAPSERTDTTEHDQPAGRGRPGQDEGDSAHEAASAGELPETGVSPEGLAGREPDGAGGEVRAGQPGVKRGGDVGRGSGGQGRGDVGGDDETTAATDTGRGSDTRPETGGGGGLEGHADPDRESELSARDNALSADENHRIEPGDTLAPSGDKTKARANIAAIKLLRTLEKQKRNATPEEKRALAQYVGWGGLPNIFDEGMASNREYKWLSDDQKAGLEKWEKAWGD